MFQSTGTLTSSCLPVECTAPAKIIVQILTEFTDGAGRLIHSSHPRAWNVGVLTDGSSATAYECDTGYGG